MINEQQHRHGSVYRRTERRTSRIYGWYMQHQVSGNGKKNTKN